MGIPLIQDPSGVLKVQDGVGAIPEAQETSTSSDLAPMIDSTGNNHYIPAEQVAHAQSLGYKGSTEDGLRQNLIEKDLQAKYGDSPIEAGLEGFGRGLTLGGTDVLHRLIDSPEDLEARREREKRNAVAAGIGNVAGAVAANFVPGLGIVGDAGNLVKEGIAGTEIVSGLASGGKVAQAVARYIPAIAAGTVEGSVYGAAQGVSKVALSDQPIAVEMALSTVANNALWGGVTGAATAGAFQAFGDLVRGGSSLVSSALARNPETQPLLQNIASGITESTPEVVAGAQKNIQEELGTLFKRKSPGDPLVDHLVSHLDQMGEAGQELGSRLRTAQALAQDFGKASSIEEVIQNAKSKDKVVQEAIDKLGGPGVADVRISPEGTSSAFKRPNFAIIDQATELLPGFRADTILKNAELAGLSIDDATLKSVYKIRNPEGSFEALQKDPALYRDFKAETLANTAKEMLSQSSSSAGGMTGSLINKAPGYLLGLASSALGIPHWVMAGGVAMSVARKALTGKIGQAIRGQAGNLAEHVTNFLGKTTQVAADLSPTAASILASHNFGKAPELAKPGDQVWREPLHQQFHDRSQELTRLATDPNIHDKLAGSFASVRAIDPKMADQMVDLQVNRIKYLYGEMPKDQTTSMLPGYGDWMPPDSAIAEWSRKVEVASNPAAVTRDLQNGTVTPEQVDALKALWPAHFQAIQSDILTQAADLEDHLPFGKQVLLSVLFETPVNPLMEPDIVASMMDDFSTLAKPKDQPNVSQKAPSPTEAQKVQAHG